MKDHVVVITGASAGIGAALARQVSRRGAHVVLLARRKQQLEEVARSCAGRSHVEVVDVTRREDVQRGLDAAVRVFGHVDVWVNNAGRGISRPVMDLTDDDVDEMMRVNVKSALYGMQVAARHFIQRGRGHILNVSSMLGKIPFASVRSAYSASKHALNALTTNLRVDLKATHPNIHVTLVLPGVVATEFGLNALGGGMDSRRFPNAQDVEEVAAAMVGAMEHPVAELYTRPEYQQQVARHYSAPDVAVLEAQPPFVMPPR